MTTELRRRPPTLRNQRGIALILVVMALLCLTGLLVAYLSVSALEPQISRNLADASRARYLAEAGIERGFNVLVSTADASDNWSGLLSGAMGMLGQKKEQTTGPTPLLSFTFEVKQLGVQPVRDSRFQVPASYKRVN